MSISNLESKAVLELTKYFSDHWKIVDCGSNKGQWSDILIGYRDSSTEAGKYIITMIEPNGKLLNYLQVKYDYNENVDYLEYAISNTSFQYVDFWYWENKNSGLSSILKNEKWANEMGVGEHRKLKTVETIRLDEFLGGNIDIIKIDIEGAEYLALQGAEKLLKEKKVKFFQVEYSEHYQIAGYTFKDIIRYVNQFGYNVWSYDGEYFNKLTEETFIEDYRFENFYITYLEIGRYHYTQLWNNEFKKNTEFLKKSINFAIEIGCYEGLTSNYICDELLNKDGRLICIDPLTDEYLPGHKDNNMFVGQYERFIKNTKGQPIELIRKKSEDVWNDIKAYAVDFCYIDGNHNEDSVYNDAQMIWNILKVGGYILFDDYEWAEETKRGIDKFIKYYEDLGNMDGFKRIEVLVKEYQVLIKKIAH